MVTVTPGKIAPVPSAALPKISPVLTCAIAGTAQMPTSTTKPMARLALRRTDLIVPLLHEEDHAVHPQNELVRRRIPRCRASGNNYLGRNDMKQVRNAVP